MATNTKVKEGRKEGREGEGRKMKEDEGRKEGRKEGTGTVYGKACITNSKQ